ncbi:MAG: hypothetical protein AAF591_14490 [Verrucomicrobiota bacterium]
MKVVKIDPKSKVKAAKQVRALSKPGMLKVKLRPSDSMDIVRSMLGALGQSANGAIMVASQMANQKKGDYRSFLYLYTEPPSGRVGDWRATKFNGRLHEGSTELAVKKFLETKKIPTSKAKIIQDYSASGHRGGANYVVVFYQK